MIFITWITSGSRPKTNPHSAGDIEVFWRAMHANNYYFIKTEFIICFQKFVLHLRKMNFRLRKKTAEFTLYNIIIFVSYVLFINVFHFQVTVIRIRHLAVSTSSSISFFLARNLISDIQL